MPCPPQRTGRTETDRKSALPAPKMAKRFLLCALFACSVAGTRASNNETCPSEACIRIAEEEYRGWPCEDGPNCTWTLLDLEFTVTKTEVGSGDDLNLTGISGGPFLYTKACRRFFLQYFDGINGSRAYNCSITNVKSLPDDVFTSDIIFCTISWLVEMSVLFHCWHQVFLPDSKIASFHHARGMGAVGCETCTCLVLTLQRLLVSYVRG